MNPIHNIYPVDSYEGRMQSVHRKRKWARRIILVAQFFERIAFYSLTANMVLFLTANPYKWTSHNASSAALILAGTTFVSALFGGMLADSCLGRFGAILVGYFLYIIAYIGFPILFYQEAMLLSLSNSSIPEFCKLFTVRRNDDWINITSNNSSPSPATDEHIWLFQEQCGGFVLIMMLGVSVGSGFLKAVFAPFGADQVLSDSGVVLRSYFNTYYWVVNSGSFVAYFVMGYVQQNVSLFAGYSIPWLALIISALIFLSGYRLYYHRPVTGSVLIGVLSVIKEAMCRSLKRSSVCCGRHSTGIGCCCCGNSSDSVYRDYTLLNNEAGECDRRASVSSALPNSIMSREGIDRGAPSHSHLSSITSVNSMESSSQYWENRRRPTRATSDADTIARPHLLVSGQGLTQVKCLDLAKYRYGGTHHESIVDDVRSLGRTVFLLLFLIPYWLVYYQMQSEFLVQGLHMRLDVFSYNAQAKTELFHYIPVSWLHLADVLSVLLVIPLLNKILYPFLDRKSRHLSLYQRIVIGMLFSLFAVLIAAALERKRFDVFWESPSQQISQYIGGRWYKAADLSILWQCFQYAFIGLGEAFTCVAGLELAYGHSPKVMQSVMSGIFYFINGIAGLLGAFLITAFYGVFFFDYDYGDPNCKFICKSQGTCRCHLDYYFFVLSGIQGIGILGFILASYLLQDKLWTRQKLCVSNEVNEQVVGHAGSIQPPPGQARKFSIRTIASRTSSAISQSPSTRTLINDAVQNRNSRRFSSPMFE